MSADSENRKSPPERVLAAMELLAKLRYSEARRELMLRYNLSRSAATRVIKHAREFLTEEEIEVRPHIRAQIVVTLNDLIDAARKKGDYNAAIRGVRELTRIYGIAAPDKVDVTIGMGGEKLEKLTDDQLRALAALDEQTADDGGGSTH